MAYEGLFLDEDAAIKAKMAGLTVSDINNDSRSVAVFYRDPEIELRNTTFPLAVIDFLRVRVDSEREHRGNWILSFDAAGNQYPDDGTTRVISLDDMIPLALDYQVTVMTRSARHMKQLAAALMSRTRLHPRFAFLEVAQDQTLRRLVVIPGPASSYRDASAKRVFQMAYSLSVPAELRHEDLVYGGPAVRLVNLLLHEGAFPAVRVTDSEAVAAAEAESIS